MCGLVSISVLFLALYLVSTLLEKSYWSTFIQKRYSQKEQAVILRAEIKSLLGKGAFSHWRENVEFISTTVLIPKKNGQMRISDQSEIPESVGRIPSFQDRRYFSTMGLHKTR